MFSPTTSPFGYSSFQKEESFRYLCFGTPSCLSDRLSHPVRATPRIGQATSPHRAGHLPTSGRPPAHTGQATCPHWATPSPTLGKALAHTGQGTCPFMAHRLRTTDRYIPTRRKSMEREGKGPLRSGKYSSGPGCSGCRRCPTGGSRTGRRATFRQWGSRSRPDSACASRRNARRPPGR